MPHAPATVTILLAGLAFLAWLAPDVMLVLFAAVLMAVALRAGALPLARRTGLGEGWAALGVMAGVVLLFALTGWLFADSLTEELRQAAQDLPRGWGRVDAFLADLPGPDWLARLLRPAGPAPTERLVGYAAAGLGGTLGMLTNLLLILLVGLFLAAAPGIYRRGALALLAPGLRARGGATLDAMGVVLRGWLLGQLFAMVVSGTLTYLGLWALDIPLAGLLSVVTAVAGFIPYLGPVIGLMPAALITLAHDPSLVVWVVGLFLLVQNVEGNILTPMVQQETSDVPAALLLAVQALFGTALGALGVLLAAPIAAAALAAMRVAYVEGWVEKELKPRRPPVRRRRRR